jgi:tetratricopeptide (TPR) repeat protein
MTFKPFDWMWEQVQVEYDNSEVAYFNSLMYLGEMLTKLVAAGMVAAVDDARDRQQYRLKYQLVRADGLGDWAKAIDEVLTGVPAQYLIPSITDEGSEANQLTQRSKSGEWQYDSIALLDNCLKQIAPNSERLANKVSGRIWFRLFVELRNKTRGHGAPSGKQLARLCDDLRKSIQLVQDNFLLFQRGWAYLSPTYKRKYHIVRWTDSASSLDFLKSREGMDYTYHEGVYIHFGTNGDRDSLRRVDVVFFDVDTKDVFLPNGGFNDKRFEVLCYPTNSKRHEDAKPYLDPITELPPSETQGLPEIQQRGRRGSTIVNLPPRQNGYIPRTPPENSLYRELVEDNQHRIITLIGRGGIGKTWLALEVLNRLAEEEIFDAILWFSARDIDLLTDGAKQVKPHILTESDIAEEFARLIAPYLLSYEAIHVENFNAIDFLRNNMGKCDLGKILLVFDNFETVKSPVELFFWIDNYLRLPNKALITTRFREFKGDYPVELLGMSSDECRTLIDVTARQLGIESLLTPEYIEDLYNESDGHPYIIKILMGEIRKAGRLQKIDKIISARDDLLDTLFERTYSRLSLAAQRVFLTLCNWKSLVAQTAVEAVLLRPDNERMDVAQAIEDLSNSSLIEKTASATDEEVFLAVPLVAMQFGQRKLSVSRMQMAIQADTELLRFFGAIQESDIKHGIEPRIRRLFREIEQRVSGGKDDIEQFIHILEFIAKRYPYVWRLLANLYIKAGQADRGEETLRQYLEFSDDLEGRKSVWHQLIQLYSVHSRYSDELFAHIQLAQTPGVDYEIISNAVNRFNSIVRQPGFEFDEGEKDQIINKLIDLMESRLEEADATDCSRLGWLYMHRNQTEKAMEVVERGLQSEPDNEYCVKLQQRLQGR